MDIALGVQLLIWLLVLGIFLASSQATIFHPATLYVAFHGLVFVVRPFLVWYAGFDSVWNYMILKPSETDLVRTLAVSTVGLISFMIAACVVGRSDAYFDKKEVRLFSERERLALILTTICLLPIMVYSISLTAGQGGSAGELGERAANGNFIMTRSTGYFTDAQLMTGPLIFAWLLVTRFHPFNLIPLFVFVGYRAWCGWARSYMVLFLLMVLIAWCWQNRKRWLPVWSLAVALPVVVLFNLLGQNRELFHKEQKAKVFDGTTAAMPWTERTRKQVDTQDFANFDYLAALVTLVPARTGTYTYGAQYLQLVTEPIPRILWKEKPTGSPLPTFSLLAYINFVGLTYSLPGDGWVSCGWIGLVILMSFAGTILGLGHRFFWNHANNPVIAIVYISALSVIIQWYRDGGISIAKFLPWCWLPLFIWMGVTWMLGRRLVPSTSIILCRGSAVRLVQHGSHTMQEPVITHIILEARSSERSRTRPAMSKVSAFVAGSIH